MVLALLLWTLLFGPLPPPEAPPPHPPDETPPAGGVWLPPFDPTVPPPEVPDPDPPPGGGCVRFDWEHPGHEHLSHFQLFVSRSSGVFTPADLVGGVEAVSALTTEYPCHRVHLYEPGRYYAVVEAVPNQPSPEEHFYSNEICLEVWDGQIYACP
jgi:hypothetical protein